MPDDVRTVEVTIAVEASAAMALDDATTRARVGRLVSRMLALPTMDSLGGAIAALKAEAHRRGLTDELIDEELTAYNAERRDVPSPR